MDRRYAATTNFNKPVMFIQKKAMSICENLKCKNDDSVDTHTITVIYEGFKILKAIINCTHQSNRWGYQCRHKGSYKFYYESSRNYEKWGLPAITNF